MTALDWVLVAWFAMNTVFAWAMIGQEYRYTVGGAVLYTLIAGGFIWAVTS